MRKKDSASLPAPQEVAPEKVENYTPTLEEVRSELRREQSRRAYRGVLGSTVAALLVAAAIAVLITMLFLPVLRIYGSSMAPTLADGEIVVTLKTAAPERGDIIAFYYNNKILIKRVVAVGGDIVEIDEDGAVSINGETLDEPYVAERARGECDIEMPYRVPEGKFFVLGDKRTTSVDSRNTVVGCVAEEQIVGKVLLRAWPLGKWTVFK